MRCRRADMWLAAAAALLAAAGLGVTTDVAHAQGSTGDPSALGVREQPAGRVRLKVPNLLLVAPASEALLAIRLENAASLPPNSFLRIQGLPPKIALSEGHAIAPGAWAVPLSALANLRVVVPAGISGRSDVSVSVATIDGGVATTTKLQLVVAAAIGPAGGARVADQGPARAATATTPGPTSAGRVVPRLAPPADAAPALVNPQSAPAPSPAPAPAARPAPAPPKVAALPPPTVARPPAPPASDGPRLSPEDKSRADSFLEKGRERLKQGNVALARLFFQRAADIGLAEGALAMGDTFDATELARNGAIGIQPDADEARRWYEKARELGAGVVVEGRLRRLGNR